MKRFMFLFAAMIIGAFLINSCSDSDNSTDNPKGSDGNYYPLTVGNYWVYQSESNDESTIDSTVVTGTESLQGKNASIQTTYTDGADPSTSSYYTEGSKLYSLASDLMMGGFGGLIPMDLIPNTWVLAADTKASANWTILEVPIEDFAIPYEGMDILVSGTFKVTGSNKGKVGVQTPAGTFDAVQNDMIFSFSGSMKAGVLPVPLNFEINLTSYFSENVGLVKAESKHQTISAMGMTLLEIPQSSSVLLRYNVAK